MARASNYAYGSEWGVGYLWHRMDWLVRADVVALALLFAYTVAVVIRIFRCYHTARCEKDVNRATRTKLAAELNIQAGNLKSIASIAPYLGLVGTCLGILSAFSGVGMQRDAALAWMTSKMAAALVPPAAGIVVAIPATCGCEYARMRLDLLVNELRPRRKHRLTNRFTLAPFALIAAWGLAIFVLVYMPLAPGHTPKGFDIGIASARCDSDLSDRLIVLHISNGGRIFLNLEEEQDWGTLQSRLSEIYTTREQRILYVLADEGVRFQILADAIDTVENAWDRLTSRPLNITIRLITPKATNAACPEPVVSDSTLHRSR